MTALSLRELLSEEAVIDSPILYEPVMAGVAERLGLQAVCIGGATVAANVLALPDGLQSTIEVVEQVRQVHAATNLAITVDLDDGGGIPPLVYRNTRLAEDAGASAIMIEDVDWRGRWRWNDTDGKWIFQQHCLHSQGAAADLIRIAVEARRNAATVVIGRTEAMGSEGYDGALQRAQAFVAAGADAVFIVNLPLQRVAEAELALGVPMIGYAREISPTERAECIAAGLRLILYNPYMTGDVYSQALSALGQLHRTRGGPPLSAMQLPADLPAWVDSQQKQLAHYRTGSVG